MANKPFSLSLTHTHTHTHGCMKNPDHRNKRKSRCTIISIMYNIIINHLWPSWVIAESHTHTDTSLETRSRPNKVTVENVYWLNTIVTHLWFLHPQQAAIQAQYRKGCYFGSVGSHTCRNTFAKFRPLNLLVRTKQISALELLWLNTTAQTSFWLLRKWHTDMEDQSIKNTYMYLSRHLPLCVKAFHSTAGKVTLYTDSIHLPIFSNLHNNYVNHTEYANHTLFTIYMYMIPLYTKIHVDTRDYIHL